ncbi:MAG: hypothetical protein EPO07_14940 [Verrucomicrobia bacterium]|nr:MAG: hypothetical protein EPO07_14940 [Verrucomicrobiota bacterium]
MPREQKNAEAALQKLGQRVRAGWAKKHPISERSIATVRTTVREQWEIEQKAKRERMLSQKPPTKNKGKGKGRGQEPEI